MADQPIALAAVPAAVPAAATRARARARTGNAWVWLALLGCAAVCVAFVALPVGLLHPFRPQSALEVSLAYEMRRASPWLTLAGAAATVLCVARLVRGTRRRWSWVPIGLLVALVGLAAWFARQNHFEWMFEPLRGQSYAEAEQASFLEPADMVLSVDTGADAVAYPVRQLAYHHLVADAVGGTPVVATYCTLCHTGLVWQRTLDGRVLTFRLYGINNQNMLMRDEETGSWWQQATGEAIQGPLKGRRLVPFLHSEVTFEVFRREHPGGRVLRPAPEYEASYARSNWERRMKKVPTVTPRAAGDTIAPRTHVLGVALGQRARAYPFPAIRKGGPVNDVLDGVPIAVVVGEDRRSVRVFERTVAGRPLEFAAKTGVRPLAMVDLQTGSEWDFAGLATSGPLAGHRLRRLIGSKQYWFDWKLQRPYTTVYARGIDG
ncbi:MAG: DUF3179 domain-containing (seleno)protein [Vicinamibacteria bacterium]